MKTARMGRPPKQPDERKDEGLRIPLTSDEKALIERCAEADGKKPITWAREALLRIANRSQKRREGVSIPSTEADPTDSV